MFRARHKRAPVREDEIVEIEYVDAVYVDVEYGDRVVCVALSTYALRALTSFLRVDALGAFEARPERRPRPYPLLSLDDASSSPSLIG